MGYNQFPRIDCNKAEGTVCTVCGVGEDNGMCLFH